MILFLLPCSEPQVCLNKILHPVFQMMNCMVLLSPSGFESQVWLHSFLVGSLWHILSTSVAACLISLTKQLPAVGQQALSMGHSSPADNSL